MMLTSRMLLLAAVCGSIEAFCPNAFFGSHPPRYASKAAGALHLKIEDGKDLVAASKQVYRPSHHADNDDEETLVSSWDVAVSDVCPSVITAPRSAAISFVKRLFAQPTAAFHPHQAESLDDFDAKEEDDVVYFPVRALFR